MLPARRPDDPNDSTTASTSAGRAMALVFELTDIGRSVELIPGAWPIAQRAFRAQVELRQLIGEAFR